MTLVELNALFDITYGNKLDYNKMKLLSAKDKNAVAFVSRTRENNGVVAHVEKFATIKPYPAGYITVALGGSVLSSFIQANDFYTAQNIAVLQPKIAMDFQTKAYYCLVIKSNAYRYSTCGREANKTLKTLLVPSMNDLPNYVGQYSPDYSHLSKPLVSIRKALVFSSWRHFSYEQLFVIKKGKRITKLDMIPGNTPFLSATAYNNGVRELAGVIPLFKENTIAVNYNGSVAEATYQEHAYWASDDVNVLYPRFELNKYIAMFIITVIQNDKYRYNYARKWNKERMRKSTLMLPSKTDGTPDFEYMEEYIKSIPYSSSI